MIAYLSGLLHQAALSSYCTDGSEGTVVDASWSLPSCSLSLTNGLREIVEKPSKLLGLTFSEPASSGTGSRMLIH